MPQVRHGSCLATPALHCMYVRYFHITLLYRIAVVAEAESILSSAPRRVLCMQSVPGACCSIEELGVVIELSTQI